MKVSELLRELSEASGVSGYEMPVRRVVREALSPLVDEVREDVLGNVIALKRGTGHVPRRGKVMLAAHLDEIGLMVTKIDKGFLRVTQVGGIDTRTLLGQEVMVHGREALPGIIGSRPPHVLPEADRAKPVGWEELFIDVGLGEAVSELVRVGDLITIRRKVTELKGDRWTGKAFDDRTAVVAVARCLELLGGLLHEWDVYAVATTQEETGLKGAMTSAYGIAPDLAIAIDVGFGASPGLSERDTIEMDKGPSIGFGANITPVVHDRLVQVAKENEIPYQIEPLPGRSGTDAWAIQVSREGIPTGLLSIPLRYMHTPVETVVGRDIDRTGRLVAHFVASLDADFANQLRIWQ